MNNILLSIAAVVFVGLLYLAFVHIPQQAEARQWPGNIATLATTTIAQSVTAGTVELLFASSSCSSRIIGSRTGELRLSFSDAEGASERPTATAGFGQSASSTVVYDAEVYGCGAVYVYPYVSETISVAEYQ